MPRLIACLALLLPASLSFGQANAAAGLEALAAQADLVALAQVVDTDYQYTREFPSGGTAFLRILIPYKVTRPYGELIQVYEEGLHEHECYFPEPPIGEEGRRYLVVLQYKPDRPAQFIGLPQGCALEVLVTADNGYALRYPLDGIELAGTSSEMAQELVFSDRHAVVSDEDLTVAIRNAWLAAGWLRELADGRFAYTHGIPLGGVRDMIGEENLTQDRNLLRPESE